MANWRRSRSRRGPVSAGRPTTLRAPIVPLEERCVPASLTLTVGPNVNVSHLPGNDSEAAIAVNPTNPKNVAVVCMDEASANMVRVYHSFDGGTTWADQDIGPALSPQAAGDGQIKFDKFGNLFVTLLDFSAGCQLLMSSDGGQTFTLLGDPIPGSVDRLSGLGPDQPSIAVGPGPTPGTGSIWISAALSILNNQNVLTQVIEVDGALITGLGKVGAFNTLPATVPGSIAGNFGDIAVGPKGQVLVTFEAPAFGTGPAGIYMSVNSQGLTALTAFSQAKLVTKVNVGGMYPIPAQPNRAIDAEANLAYDRSGGSHNGRAYLVYTDAPSALSSATNIFVRYSDDSGTTWSNAVRVNDDTGTNSQFFSSIAVDQATGNLAVGWMDCRNSATNTQAEYFVSASTDGGSTFLPNAQVSRGLSDVFHKTGVPPDQFDFGDFYYLDVYNNAIHVVWPDNSTALGNNPDLPNFDLATATITIGNNSGGGPGGSNGGTILVGADAGLPPIVRLVNSATGATVFQTMAFSPTFTGGVRVARGDVNGDGTPDLIVAAGPGGGPQVKVFDGVTHRVIANFYAFSPVFTGGVYVAAGDVNAATSAGGDRIDDVIVGAGAGGGPQVKVFNVADGTLMRNFYAFSSSFKGGVTVAAGDVDGAKDAKGNPTDDDIVVGAGPGGGPQVKVFDSASGSVLASFFAYSPAFHGGVTVAAGDLNGDGNADLVVGAGPGSGNEVRAFSGADGQELLDFTAGSYTQPVITQLGPRVRVAQGVRVAAEDLDGDGLADIVLAPGAGISPVVQVRKGRTGALIESFPALDPAFLGGVFVG
jgi:hypothetical protein